MRLFYSYLGYRGREITDDEAYYLEKGTAKDVHKMARKYLGEPAARDFFAELLRLSELSRPTRDSFFKRQAAQAYKTNRQKAHYILTDNTYVGPLDIFELYQEHYTERSGKHVRKAKRRHAQKAH